MDKYQKIAALVISAQQGSESAFQELYEFCFDSVYYLALRVMKNAEDAEDVAQEAFMSAFRNLRKLKEPQTFTKWMNKTVYNHCLRQFEKARRDVADEGFDDLENMIYEDNEELLPELSLMSADMKDTVMKAIDDLSENQRLVIMMFYFDNYSLVEIERLTGLRQGTISKRLHDARAALKARLAQQDL